MQAVHVDASGVRVHTHFRLDIHATWDTSDCVQLAGLSLRGSREEPPVGTGRVEELNSSNATIQASGEYTAAGEVARNLLDGSPHTKWLNICGSSTSWVVVSLLGDQACEATQYTLTSANDCPQRDPAA